jgi:hypothetical protein
MTGHRIAFVAGLFLLLATLFVLVVWRSQTDVERILLKKSDSNFELVAACVSAKSENGGYNLIVKILYPDGKEVFRGTVIKSIDSASDIEENGYKVTDLKLDATNQSLTIYFSGIKPMVIPVILGQFEAQLAK